MSMFFFFNDTATTEIYTLSLHDALPICEGEMKWQNTHQAKTERKKAEVATFTSHKTELKESRETRSEEHTSELQSRQYLVCRLLLEKKKKIEFEICLAIDHLTPSRSYYF